MKLAMKTPFFPPPRKSGEADPYREAGVRAPEPPSVGPAIPSAVLQARTVSDDAETLAVCPRCDAVMHKRLHGTFATTDCPGSGGVYLNAEAIHAIVGGTAQAAAATLLTAYPLVDAPPVNADRMYVRCPVCPKLMNRTQFALGAKTVVDVCKGHGTFFDAGELPRVIDFVMNGGLQLAAKKELERTRERRQSELANARYLAGRSPVSTFEQRQIDYASASPGELLIDVFVSLLIG